MLNYCQNIQISEGLPNLDFRAKEIIHNFEYFEINLVT